MNAVVRRDWKIAEQDWTRARALAQTLDLSPLVGHLLLLRGIDTPEKAQEFLHPRLAHLSDPLLLTGMREAVARIEAARARDEHIHVFGDYDVDGISALAILINALCRFGIKHYSYGMPNRLSEGYGLNNERVEAAHADGVKLIITVDNGISAHDAARRARELGVDLIVTDHHAIEQGLPDALAVINPKREPETYSGRHLCGAGVAFKLASALNGSPNDLDIAALGTVADVVPLQGENRTIVALGLRHMAKHERVGLAHLAETAGFRLGEVSSERIGFQLGPRINAAGRLNDGLTALKLLLCDCPQESTTMARLLNQANEDRRAIEQVIYDEAVEELEARFNPAQRGIVLARRGWHAGVIGIVASRIQHKYHRPTVVVAIEEDGIGRGSARSGPGFNLVGSFTACADLLVKYGGHQAAAGLTIEEQNLRAFCEAFEQEACRQLGEGDLVHSLHVDGLASFSQIDSALVKSLERLEPLGHMNPAPMFCCMGVELIPESIQVLKEQHFKASFRQDGRVFTGIGFGMAERYYTEDFGRQVDIAFTPQLNVWRNETTVQLLLKDVRRAVG